MRQLSVTLLSLLLFALAIHWLIGWPTVWDVLSGLTPTLVAIMAVSILLSYGLRAWRLYSELNRRGSEAHFGQTLEIIVYNTALNNLLPARTGEASFPILLNRRFGISAYDGSALLLLFRLGDLAGLCLLGAVALALSPVGVSGPAAAVFALPALGLLFLSLFHRPLKRWCESHPSLPAFVLKTLNALSWSFPSSALHWLAFLAQTLLIWVLKLAGLVLTVAVMTGSPWLVATLGVIGGELASAMPFNLPGNLGTYQAGYALTALAGADQALIASMVSASIAIHMTLVFVSLLLVIIFKTSNKQISNRNSV
ncbi:flippase-like domain-containing protein [Parasalinivibrio latis]|uniref:lysylphosphatidylglycerol synthase transmembrane domain-containing protein n=1 Tax=Parasalinivibrio latis TaxID=2952610 RepID=UPI0030E17951